MYQAVQIEGYESAHKMRQKSKGGGLSGYVKKPLYFKLINCESDDFMIFDLFSGEGLLIVCVVAAYFPPKESVYAKSSEIFFDQLADYFVLVLIKSLQLLLCKISMQGSAI